DEAPHVHDARTVGRSVERELSVSAEGAAGDRSGAAKGILDGGFARQRGLRLIRVGGVCGRRRDGRLLGGLRGLLRKPGGARQQEREHPLRPPSVMHARPPRSPRRKPAAELRLRTGAGSTGLWPWFELSFRGVAISRRRRSR